MEKDAESIPVRGNTIRASFYGETETADVFAGGDCVTGPQTVVAAVARGKNAASSIDRYLGGDGQIVAIKTNVRTLSAPIDETPRERAEAHALSACCRTKASDEVALGMTEEEMLYETGRCLRCDVLKVSRL